MIYVENSQCITQSDGVINVVSQLGGPWRFAKILRIIPKGIRDWAYDRIAFNRYRLFGKYDYQIVTMISITYKALNVVLKSQQFNLVETDHGQHRPRITYFS